MRSVLLALGLCAAGWAQMKPGSAAAEGLAPARLDRAGSLLDAEVKAGRLGAASLLVARHGRIVLQRGFGSAGVGSVFLLASITKPVTASAVMLLVERGMLSLGDPVERYLPEFKGGERGKVRVRDLLTHTSGLPDMLPENTELRRAHAPLSEFVGHASTTPLLYSPETEFRYQSMGVLLAGEIVERLARMPLRDFLRREIFEPLGMRASSLGLGGRKAEDLVPVMDPPGAVAADEQRFGWNTTYWRDLGAPWGGMHSNTADLALLLQAFLDGGAGVFSPATVRAMLRDQNGKLDAPWGIGWALGRSRAWNVFGDLVSPRAFGHTGSTGTAAWADPETGLVAIVLTNRPLAHDDGRLLRAVSNAVAASVEK
jgi:CubicO group peptidase (beta-lactamase class C family)